MGKLSKLLNRHAISFKVESNLAGNFIKSTTSATHYNVADEIVNELNAIKRWKECSHEETAALPLQNVVCSALTHLVEQLNNRCIHPEKDADLLIEELQEVGVYFAGTSRGWYVDETK